jgi:hypothetical protein
MYDFAKDDLLPNADELRARLGKMNDTQLLRQGKAAAYMCDPRNGHGEPPRQTFVIQLDECRAEWRRRHPNPAGQASDPDRSGGRDG